MKSTARALLAVLLYFGMAEFAGVASAEAVIAPSAEEVKPLAVGAKVPDVQITNLKGKERSLAKVVEGKKSVIVFYRGGWCPYCNTHLAALGQTKDELKALGYEIIALSPDKFETAKKTSEKEEVNYKLFSDNSFAAAKAFGVAFKMDAETQAKYQEYFKDKMDHDFSVLPVPSVFLTNESGEITFAHANADYKVRLGKDELLAAAKGDS